MRGQSAARISNCSAKDGFGLKAYLACRLRIMWIISIPDRMVEAVAVDLKPSIGRTRRLMRRWCCSIQLLSGMNRRDAPIRIFLHGWIDYRPPTGIGVSGARMAGRPKYLMN